MKKLRSKAKEAPSESGTNILDRVQNVEDLRTVVTAVLYGRSGTGKTTLSSTFPTPLLVLDISEKGTDSIADVPGVKMLQVNDWSDFEEIYWELARKNTMKFKSVTIDSVHALQSLAIRKVKEDRDAKETDQTTKHDFMKASGLLQTWLINYRDLQDKGINVVFIAHDRTYNAGEEDDTDGQLMPEVGPRLMPSVSSALCGAVKIVGNTFIRERIERTKVAGKKPKRTIEYCLRLGPNAIHTTKIRSPKSSEVPDYIVDPDYKQLLEVMKGRSPRAEEATPAKPRRRLG